MRNFALGAPSSQSSTAYDGASSRATDGNSNGSWGALSVTHTAFEANPWWQVDLGAPRHFDGVEIWNRTDCCAERLSSFWLFTSATPFKSNDPKVLAADPTVTAELFSMQTNPQMHIPRSRLARYVRIQLANPGILSLAEVKVLGPAWTTNYSAEATATQSSTGWGGDAALAIDGNPDGRFADRSVTHTQGQPNPWWQADLGHSKPISMVRVWRRTDCCKERMDDYWVQISDTPFTSTDPNVDAARSGVYSFHSKGATAPITDFEVRVGGVLAPVPGRYVRILIPGNQFLSLAEVEILGPQLRNYVPGGTATQSSADYGGTPTAAQDGNTDGNHYNNSLTHTALQNNPYWQVKLAAPQKLSQIKVWNRTDCCADRLRDFWIFLSATPFTSDDPAVTAKQQGVTAVRLTGVTTTAARAAIVTNLNDVNAQYLRVQIAGRAILSLAEVEAFGSETFKPVDVRAWNSKHPFGMLVTYGMGTATNQQLTTPGTQASQFRPGATVDPKQWATAMKSAGMNWGVLTVKNNDGFALWPTAYSAYSIRNATSYQLGNGDIMRDYANAMRAQNLDVGISYSIRDRTTGETPALVKNQLRELLTQYGPISYILFDGWEAPGVGANRISYNEVRDFVRNLSPNTVVANNDQANQRTNGDYQLTNSDFQVTTSYDQLRVWPADDEFPKAIVTFADSEHTWFWTTKSGAPFTSTWMACRRDEAVNVNGHSLLNVGPRLDGTIDPRYVAVIGSLSQIPLGSFVPCISGIEPTVLNTAEAVPAATAATTPSTVATTPSTEPTASTVASTTP